MKLFIVFIIFFSGCANQTYNIETHTPIVETKIKMAITVDDLPSHGPYPINASKYEIAHKLLNALQKYRIPEVYGFVNAAKVIDDPKMGKILQMWVDAGYPLGNHTFTHKKLADVTSDEYIQEIEQVEPVLQKYGNKFNWKVFRYTFLNEGENAIKRKTVRSYLLSRGYLISEVTINTKDWNWNDAYVRCLKKNQKKQIAWLRKTFLENAVDELQRGQKMAQVLYHRPIPHILLMHVGAFSAEIADDLFKIYKNMGVVFISHSDAVKDPMYGVDPGFTTKGSTLLLKMMENQKLQMSDVGISPKNQFDQDQLESICK